MTRKTESKQEDRDPRRPLTDVEWTIIETVWEHEPCAAGAVQEALAESRDWAYSTVKTTMDRMVVKGLLATQSIRNLTLYSSRVSRKEARRGELQHFLKKAFDGALTPMIQFLVEEEELSDAELEEIRRLVRKSKRGK